MPCNLDTFLHNLKLLFTDPVTKAVQYSNDANDLTDVTGRKRRSKKVALGIRYMLVCKSGYAQELILVYLCFQIAGTG